MFGAGYVGLVTGACFADLGHEVVIRDVVPERIERLQAGEVPIYEPGLELVLERNADRIRFTLDVARGGGRRRLPLRRRRDAADRVRRRRPARRVVGRRRASVRPAGPPVVVMKSTVPVGTGEHVRERLDAPRPHERRLRLEPGVPRRGQRRRRLHEPRPPRRRRVRRRRRRPRRRAAPRDRDARSCAPTSRRRSS